MNGAMLSYLLVGVGVPVALTVAAFAYGRRPARRTMTVSSTYGIQRGMVMAIDGAGPNGVHGGELFIVRRVLGPMSVAIDPYTGWRRLANRTRARWRRRFRALEDRVHGWFEEDCEDDD